MIITRYENQACNIDAHLLKNDEYCFFVLSRILKGECRLTLTDNERIIVCHSCDPFPVWVWLPNDATEKEMEKVYCLVKENFSLDGKYRFNLKYDLAKYFINRGKNDGYEMKISTNMLVYNCESPTPPTNPARGELCLATLKDLDLVTSFMNEFHKDVGIDLQDINAYREKAKVLINEAHLYFWCDENGEKVAMTSYGITDDKGSVGNVFTRRDKRRMGYGASLVYAVTEIIKAQGKMPTLYTDADYEASNGCYEKIGYKRQGSLCTLAINTRSQI